MDTRTIRRRRAATAIEYLLLVGVVALGAAAAHSQFQASVTKKTGKQGECVTSLDCNYVGTVGSAGKIAAPSGTGIGDPSGVCFAAGTLVATPRGLIAIDELRIGDELLSAHEGRGARGVRRVVRTFRHEDQVVTRLLLGRGARLEVLLVTEEHPFYVPSIGGFVAVRDLVPGFTEVGVMEGASLRVLEARTMDRTETVYNLEVEDFHTYFVGDSGVWVHNQYARALSDANRAAGGAPPGAPGLDNLAQDAINRIFPGLGDTVAPGLTAAAFLHQNWETVGPALAGARLALGPQIAMAGAGAVSAAPYVPTVLVALAAAGLIPPAILHARLQASRMTDKDEARQWQMSQEQAAAIRKPAANTLRIPAPYADVPDIVLSGKAFPKAGQVSNELYQQYINQAFMAKRTGLPADKRRAERSLQLIMQAAQGKSAGDD